MKIELNTEEIFQGAVVGIMRMTKALRRGNNTINSPDKDRLWHFHIEGALAEMAVAKHLDRYWSSGDVDAVDVGNFEIRVTPRMYSVVMRERDVQLGKEDKIFIGCRGKFGKYEIMGWIVGRDGMKDEYWRDPTNTGRSKAWFVPANKLNPISKLVADVGTDLLTASESLMTRAAYHLSKRLAGQDMNELAAEMYKWMDDYGDQHGE